MPGAIIFIKKGMKISKRITRIDKKIIKKKQIIAENFCALSDLSWCKSLEYMGKNEEVIAPSAVILLNKFGNLDEIKKISDAIPAPIPPPHAETWVDQLKMTQAQESRRASCVQGHKERRN